MEIVWLPNPSLPKERVGQVAERVGRVAER